MYAISNQDRDEIILMLRLLRETYSVGKSLRKANIVRKAGLLIEKLEQKKEIPNKY